ncbi:MFS transporter [Burkholderia mallei]
MRAQRTRRPASRLATASAMNADSGLPFPQRYWAIVCVALGITLAVLDGAIANVALPTIARDLRASDAASIWIVNAYQLAVTISLLPLASLGDRIGYRRVYIAGLMLFTAASLGCALSGTLPALATLRVIQGFGAAGIMSVNTALVRMIYPSSQLGAASRSTQWSSHCRRRSGRPSRPRCSPSRRGRALRDQRADRRRRRVRQPARAAANPGRSAPYDFIGAVMNACVFGLLIVSVDGLGHGGNRASVALTALVAAVIGYFFVKRQLTQPAPLLPVDLMRVPIFALSIGTSVASFTSQMLAFVALPFWLQNTLGFSQVQTGLYMTPWPLVIVVAAPLAGVLSDRYSAGALGGIGLALFASGLFALATIGAHPTPVDIMWRMALCGAGFGSSSRRTTARSCRPRRASARAAQAGCSAPPGSPDKRSAPRSSR